MPNSLTYGENRINIGIIGSGKIGGTASRLFAIAGHNVAISNSRGPESLGQIVARLGPNVRATTVEEAESFARILKVQGVPVEFQTFPGQAHYEAPQSLDAAAAFLDQACKKVQ